MYDLYLGTLLPQEDLGLEFAECFAWLLVQFRTKKDGQQHSCKMPCMAKLREGSEQMKAKFSSATYMRFSTHISLAMWLKVFHVYTHAYYTCIKELRKLSVMLRNIDYSFIHSTTIRSFIPPLFAHSFHLYSFIHSTSIRGNKLPLLDAPVEEISSTGYQVCSYAWIN